MGQKQLAEIGVKRAAERHEDLSHAERGNEGTGGALLGAFVRILCRVLWAGDGMAAADYLPEIRCTFLLPVWF